MPELPTWIAGGRIMWDTDYPTIVYVRKGRRQPWAVWSQTSSKRMTLLFATTGPTLVSAREYWQHKVADAIETSVRALHPAAPYRHSWKTWGEPRCGAPTFCTTAADKESITCPTCLGHMVEEAFELAKSKLTPDQLKAAREAAAASTTMDRMGKLTG
jgi:hypothetical protein